MGSELLSSVSAVAGVVGLAVSIAACLVAWRSAVYSQRGAVAAERSAEAADRSSKAAERSAEAADRSADAAEQDIQLQAASLHREIEATQRASIVLGVTWALGSTLHVMNDGPSPAYNLDIIIRSVRPQNKSPRISSWDRQLPLKELSPGGEIKLAINKLFPVLCDVTVTFSDGNGPQQRTVRLDL